VTAARIAAGVIGQASTRGRQPDASAVGLDECRPGLALEHGDLLRDGRRRRPEPLGDVSGPRNSNALAVPSGNRTTAMNSNVIPAVASPRRTHVRNAEPKSGATAAALAAP
jgi:hypothetical protein